MNPNKTRVDKYFKTDRSFVGAKSLYPTLINIRRSFINRLNHMSATQANLSKLHYELAILAGYSDRGLTILLQQPMQVVTTTDVENELDDSQAGKQSALEDYHLGIQLDEFTLPEFEKGLPGMAARKAYAEENNITVEGRKKADFDASFEKWQNKGRNVKMIVGAPAPVKQALKLREQFPFLADENCPKVYKELVSDLITTYDKYVSAHEKLFTDLDPADITKAVEDVVMPYRENKLIWAELEHFQTKGEPLGKHPIFEMIQYKDLLQEKTANELATEKATLKSSISKAKKAKKEATEDKTRDKAIAKLEILKEKLKLVVVELESR